MVKRHVRPNKSDPLVDKADIIQLNPNYAVVRLSNGRETSVSLRDISPAPESTSSDTGDPLIEDDSGIQPSESEDTLRRSSRERRAPLKLNL